MRSGCLCEDLLSDVPASQLAAVRRPIPAPGRRGHHTCHQIRAASETAGMAEKTCQTLPLDWDNIRTKCPCCGSLMKLVMTWKSEGMQFELMPVLPASDSRDGRIDPHGNNSLMNIVSVTSAECKFKDQSSAGKFCQQDDPHHAADGGDESNDANVNDSNSSSLSNNSIDGTHSNQLDHSAASHMPFRKQPEVLPSHVPITTVSRSLVADALKSDSSAFLLSQKADLTPVPQVYDPFRTQMNQSPAQVADKFKCEMIDCVQSFANSQQLELHYKEHKGEKIQKCDWYECNRLFSSKEKLRNHIRCRHTGERPFKCGDCDKAFTSPKHLKDHRLLHTDERPFECEWEGCCQKFRRRHHLVAHKRVHTKERPYNCQYPGCEMKFTKSHHVKRHHETHFKYRGGSGDLSSQAVHLSPAAAPSPAVCSLMNSYAFPAL